jgi:hypothetical protein
MVCTRYVPRQPAYGGQAPRLAGLAIGFRAARKPDDFVQADALDCPD